MFGLVVLFHMASAESKSASESAGVFWNEIAVESSMGFQRYHHGIGGWWQQCQQSPIKGTTHQPLQNVCVHPVLDGCTNHSQFRVRIIGHTFATGTPMLDALRGASFGDDRPSGVLLAGLDLYLGGTNVIASVKPSLVTDIQVQIPIHEHTLISGV